MKARSLALLSVLGMTLTSVSVWSLTPRSAATATTESAPPTAQAPTGADPPTPVQRASFTEQGTLELEGRLGHARVLRSEGKTFVMAELRGAADLTAPAEPVSLSLVIDRSGSMRGNRFANAKKAAAAAVSRLRDGDIVSVIAFDDKAQTVVMPTVIGAGQRESVAAAIQGIALGGDTCISCGIDEAMGQIFVGGRQVRRMLLLSDGQATAGVRDVPSMRRAASRVRDRGVEVTTIGVDVDYNEVMLAAIAQEGNGRHYFVQDDASLDRVFEDEARIAISAVATDAEVSIDLAPGVELVRVFDRSFRRAGAGVAVPVGSFTAGQTKTVLLEVKLPPGATGASVDVARVGVVYRDAANGGREARATGKLEVELVDDATAASPLDGIVGARLQRNETASVLETAQALALAGRIGEAKLKLEKQADALRGANDAVTNATPDDAKAKVDGDIKGQIAAIESANHGYAPRPVTATPAAPTHDDKVNAKRSLEKSNPYKD